jgi:peptidoglycan/xylan/chitin deacetylase (PgdA/CDA1 family)
MRTRSAAAVLTALLVVVSAQVAMVPGAVAAGAVPCSRGLVALTFDDGPSTTVTGRLLDVLTGHRVPATFFVVGERVAAAPGLAQSAHRRGFAVANHTYRHEMLTRLSDEGIRATLARTADRLRAAGVRPSGLMRPPYGALDSRVRSVVSGMGLTPVLWDIDPRDWEVATPEQITARVLGALRPGGRNIVLLHDGVRRSETTLRAVPGIIRGAQARGYCFAALGASGVPVPPVPRLRVSPTSVTETDPGTAARLRFTLRLDRPTSREVSVRVRTVAGSATSGADYRPVDRRVTFPVGHLAREVTVRVRGDRLHERRERLRLVLSAARGVTLGDRTATGTIRDDDPPPEVELTDLTVAEPVEGSVTGDVLVSLDRPSSRKVVLTLGTVAAEADELDYRAFQVRRTVAPGQRRIAVPVEVLADAVDEPVETFQVRVLSVAGGRVGRGVATVTITPPPPPPDEPGQEQGLRARR